MVIFTHTEYVQSITKGKITFRILIKLLSPQLISDITLCFKGIPRHVQVPTGIIIKTLLLSIIPKTGKQKKTIYTIDYKLQTLIKRI